MPPPPMAHPVGGGEPGIMDKSKLNPPSLPHLSLTPSLSFRNNSEDGSLYWWISRINNRFHIRFIRRHYSRCRSKRFLTFNLDLHALIRCYFRFLHV